MGAVTRFPIPLLVAIAYVVVLIFLFIAALPGATVVLVLVGLVVVTALPADRQDHGQ